MGILDILRDLQDFFYKYNPVEMSGTERKCERILPDKKEVLDGKTEPISAKEYKEEASERFNVSEGHAYNILYDLEGKNVAESVQRGQWVSIGSTKRVVNEERVMGFFIVLSVFFLVVSNIIRVRWLAGLGIAFALVSLIFWKK